MFAQILIVMIVAIVISALAERRNVQPALLVAIVGLAASFIPGMPRLELEPEIILGIVLPPMLFSAASDFSFSSFARRLGSIVNLGVFMVFGSRRWAWVGRVAMVRARGQAFRISERPCGWSPCQWVMITALTGFLLSSRTCATIRRAAPGEPPASTSISPSDCSMTATLPLGWTWKPGCASTQTPSATFTTSW